MTIFNLIVYILIQCIQHKKCRRHSPTKRSISFKYRRGVVLKNQCGAPLKYEKYYSQAKRPRKRCKIILSAVVDFPAPVSPARPRGSPLLIVRIIPFTALAIASSLIGHMRVKKPSFIRRQKRVFPVSFAQFRCKF